MEIVFSKIYEYFFDLRYMYYWIGTLIIFLLVFLIQVIRRKKVDTTLSISFIIAYYFMVYAYAVLSRDTVTYPMQLIPLWSYYDLIRNHYWLQILWISINLAMLFPIGFLLPYGYKNIKWKQVLIIAILLSYTVEFSQLLFHKGTFELFDDPLNNILGCMIGYWISKYIMDRKKKLQG